MKSFIGQLMLPQFTLGAAETLFNYLIECSPQSSAILRKLAGKILHIRLNQPNVSCFLLFSANRCDWLSAYEGEADCAVCLEASVFPQLHDKSRLSTLINDKRLILEGDLQVLQHFSMLLDELEKDPAELLSRFIGDVPAQLSTDIAVTLFSKIKNQLTQNSRDMVENLMVERPVLVHRLQAVDFYDQVEELAQQAVRLEQKFAELGIQ